MTDLDIQIDVPDDDDLGSSVRVLNGDGLPPWFKAAVILLVGTLAAIAVGAFLLGRNRAAEEDPTGTPSEETTSAISSAENSPTVAMTLAAVQAWEDFARTADLEAVAETYDVAGPQYALFATAAAGQQTAEADFTARNLTEATDGDLTVVSMDLLIDGPAGEEIFPYDMIYRTGQTRVWTVVDRRSPGTVALPPSQDIIDAASKSWTQFAQAVATGDGAAATEVVSADTITLAEQIATLSAGANAETGLSPDLESVLVARAEAASADHSPQVLIAILDPEQRRAIVNGQLSSWTMVAQERVIASLLLDGEQVTTVPFSASAEGWVVNLAAALQATEGEKG